MPVETIGKHLRIRHIALKMPELRSNTMYEDWSIKGANELSSEMVQWLPLFAVGIFEYGEQTTRCVTAASRAGCYKPQLINEVGLLSDAGDKTVIDARAINFAIDRYYKKANEPSKPFTNPTKMDEIVLNGLLPLYSIRILRYMWDLLDPIEKSELSPDLKIPLQIGQVPIPIDHTPIPVGADAVEHYVLMASVRNNKYTREASEKLVKYGLVDLKPLPVNEGRGRRPVGFTLNERGKLFYLDYAKKFNQRSVYEARTNAQLAQMNQKMPGINAERQNTAKSTLDAVELMSKMPETSEKSSKNDPSDIDPVTGENLRDLFGS